MSALFASGRIIDAILALVALEAVALAAWRWRTGRGLPPAALAANLCAGAALLLALRAALTGAAWSIVAVWLLAGLAAHAMDLRARIGAPSAPGNPRPVSRARSG